MPDATKRIWASHDWLEIPDGPIGHRADEWAVIRNPPGDWKNDVYVLASAAEAMKAQRDALLDAAKKMIHPSGHGVIATPDVIDATIVAIALCGDGADDA